jgi:CTP:molybdopterin cytidylyltransferase MocA
MRNYAKHDSVIAVILAAGAATRFGGNKQLAEFDGEALAKRATRIAVEACGKRSLLVTGHAWNAVRIACQPFPGYFVVNDAYTRGMGWSLALAVAAIRHAASAILVILADQPLISAAHLRDLLEAWSGDDREIIASRYAGTVGVPALFPKGCFDRLCELDGDAGARSLLEDAEFTLRTIAFADAAVDIDSPADLVRSANSVRS